MYLTPTTDHFACDIEADNLLNDATQIWCLTIENCLTDEAHSFVTKEAFQEWDAAHPSAIYVGHNFLSYDCVMLNRFWGTRIPAGRVVDTFVLSQLYNPSMPRPQGCSKGGHSLEAWGIRLKYPKGSFDDFTALSDDMVAYCAKDTTLAKKLFLKLTERMRMVGFTEEGAELEHQAWNIIQNQQKRNGFPFNQKKAHQLYVQLRAREEELQREIYKLWPPVLQCVAEYKQARKKDGTYSKQYLTHLGQFPKLEERPDGSYRAIDYVAFNLGSPTQRIAKLLELGWEPVNFTKKTAKGGGGNPQVDEDSLLAFAEVSGKTELLALAKWIVCNARANMIGTWLDAYNDRTGCIHGSLFIASTLRYKHSGPNSANIPAVRTKKVDGQDVILYGEEGAYAYECRDLWDCGDPSEYSLVGVDAKGIQLRVLANYAYSDRFVADVLAGDPHTNNVKILGLANKPAAKKFFYTLIMGGGGERLAVDQKQFGTILTKKDGDRLKKMMIESIPGFNDLIKELQKELSETGRIKLCDGTPILVPSPHMVIPYKLQGDESRIMKRALVYAVRALRAAGLSKHVWKVADIHDEWQWKVRNEVVDEFISIVLPCFIKAGESFGYRIIIEGDAKVGKTWAETH